MSDSTGIGYVVYCPARGNFLGRMGDFYSDIRMAQVYAEPRSAKMAINRLGHAWPCAVVEVYMTVLGNAKDAAKADVGTENPPAVSPKAPEEAKPAPKPVLRPAPKAG